MPQPRILSGSFWEDGPVTLYGLWQRDDDRTDVLPADVSSYSLYVYDLDSSTPGTPIWAVTGVSPTGVFLTRQSGVGAAPSGYNMKLQIQLGALDGLSVPWGATVGGHKYRFTVVAVSLLADLNGARAVWELDCFSVSGS